MNVGAGGILALVIAAIGAAFSVLVYRAAPHRRDNVVFAALAGLDAIMTAWRGLNVLAGDSIIDSAVTLPCSIMTIGLAVLTFEFITAFPRRRPMSWLWRGPLWAWGATAVGLLVAETDHMAHLRAAQWTFFAPATALIILLGVRAWRSTHARDARMVIGMLWFRWIFGFSAYFFSPVFDVFEAAVWAETTVATLLSFVIIGTAVLRSELFSIRSTVAEAVTIATIALLVIFGGGIAVWAVLRYSESGTTLQQALLVGATLVPLVLAAIGYAIYPRVECRVVASFDERRARRLGVQGDPIPADATEAIAEANHRISLFGDGSEVRWVPAAALPAELAAVLREGQPLRKDERPDALPADMIVPAHGAEGALVGAFYIARGTIDRDTYLVARDLAARVALAVERAEAVSALDDARRLAALGQFAAAIAHDIRTPLTSISLNVQILRRKLQLPDDDREHLDIALEELARLDKSVGEILDFAKPVKLASEEIDVGELLDTCAKGLTPVLHEKGVSLKLDARPDGVTVHGDAKRLRQVLTNLVDNAADASGTGAEVILRASAAADHVAIEVEDRGRGIATDDLPKIFDPFFTTRPDGTGLGLAICHKVVRAHGGDIKVRSAPGAGSTFTVVLPAA